MRPLAHKFRREKVEISAAVARGRQSLLWSKLGARLERPELAASASSLFTEADTRSSSGEHTSGDFRMTGKAEEEAFMLTSLTVSSWPSTAHRAMDVMLTQPDFSAYSWDGLMATQNQNCSILSTIIAASLLRHLDLLLTRRAFSEVSILLATRAIAS